MIENLEFPVIFRISYSVNLILIHFFGFSFSIWCNTFFKVIKPSSQKTKPMSPDEWLRKLDKENGCIEDDDEPNLQLQRGGRTRSSQKKKKKGKG